MDSKNTGETKRKSPPAKEVLEDHERFCAYQLPVKEPNMAVSFDFSAQEGRIFDIVTDPPVADFTIFVSHPFLFVAGGVEKATRKLSNRLWVTSAGEGTVHMSNCKALSEPRRRPFLLSPQNGVVYVVGGYRETDAEFVLACEKTLISEDVVSPLRPMHMGHSHVVSMGMYVYALGELEQDGKFECFDSQDEDAGWLMKSIRLAAGTKEVACHSAFGVAAEDSAFSRLLIFGGLTKEGMHTANTYVLDGRSGDMQRATQDFPEAEAFLAPAVVGRLSNRIITRSWKLYVNNRETKEWTSCPTNIAALMSQRGLHAK